MNVKELIEELQKYPQDYEVTFTSGDAYGSAYIEYVNEIQVNKKDKEIELK